MNKIALAQDTIGKDDIDALCEWLKTYPQLTKGTMTWQFEQQFAAYTGSKYAVFVNSGSSANLLMLYAVQRLKNHRIKKVVVPNLSWITDIAPVIQLGMQPVLVDCNSFDLSVDVGHLRKVFEKHRPEALLLVSVLGLIPDMPAIFNLCKEFDVILLEDACESLGSRYDNIHLGTFGLAGTYSLYFGHIMSTIEGGMIVTNDEELYHLLLMMRAHGWDRDLPHKQQSFLRSIHKVTNFNALYTFFELGFNFRPTDVQAFLGIRQLQKLPDIIMRRHSNYLRLQQLIKNSYWKPYDQVHQFGLIANLGYPVMHPSRHTIVGVLQAANIEVRPLICGSMVNQPAVNRHIIGLNDSHGFPNSNRVDAHGMYIPNHAALTDDDLQRMASLINSITAK